MKANFFKVLLILGILAWWIFALLHNPGLDTSTGYEVDLNECIGQHEGRTNDAIEILENGKNGDYYQKSLAIRSALEELNRPVVYCP